MAIALHFDPIEATRELEAQGFEHRQALAIVHLIQDRVLAQAGADRDHEADSIFRAIMETEQALRTEIVRLDGKIDALDAKIDTVADRLDSKIGALDAKIDAAAERLDAKIDAVADRLDTKIDALDVKIDSAVKDLTHKIELSVRDSTERASQKAEAVAARTHMWIGFASVFLGLMIAASALLPAILAIFK